METKKFVYYQENDMWVGWREEYPDYRTPGVTLDELKENIKDMSLLQKSFWTEWRIWGRASLRI